MARDDTQQERRAAVLGPDPREALARAMADLRAGLPVAIGGTVLGAVETLSDRRAALLLGTPGVVLAVTARRAATLRARAYDGDVARIVPPRGAGPAWAHAVADPTADLASPLKGPFETRRDSGAEDARAGVALARAAQLLPAVIAAPGAAPGLSHLAPEAVQAGLARRRGLADVAAARVPIAVSEAGRVHVFRPDDGGPEHYAVEVGRPDRTGSVLARVHSACFTGDVLGSLKCDCGPQLHGALDAMAAEGAGILLYLNQEGRGIGLANKMRAYALQDQGFDTVEANHRLGFEDDERDFRIGAAMLRGLGVERVRLMTNNPAKIARLEGEGVAVAERVPLIAAATRFSEAYLKRKAAAGHLL
jgi:GTP cyclohydrolase II